MAEAVLEERKVTFQQLLDPHEQEIYIAVYYRLAQCVNEKIKNNPDSVSFAEMKSAMGTLDYFIECMIQASLRGSGYFDCFRVDLMTTASLMRNAMAYKLGFLVEKQRIRFSASVLRRVEEYRKEALKGAGIVIQSYENMDKAGISYNKINAMANLMNCAAILAGLGDSTGGIDLLEKTLQRYQPENVQEDMVYQQLQRKQEEIRSMLSQKL